MNVFTQSVRSAKRAPVRSLIVMSTFALGFAFVVTVFGTVEGGRRAIKSSVYALGVDVIGCLNPVEIAGGFIRIGERGQRLIDNEVIEELRTEFPETSQVLPIRIELTRVDAKGARSQRTTTLVATGSGFQRVLRSGILAGRFLSDSDRFDPEGSEPSPAAVDEALARLVRPVEPESLIGDVLSVERGGTMIDVRVVGILRDPILLRKQFEAFDSLKASRQVKARRLEFMNVYVQYEPSFEKPSGVLVQIPDAEEVDEYGRRLQTFFESREIVANFHVQKRWIEAVVSMVDEFSYLAYFFCFVDLFVVGIICATITLLAVEMRYREFATMRAEGAMVRDVVLPVLGEGFLLATIAAPIGFGIAWLVHTFFVEPRLEWPAAYPWQVVLWTPLGIAVVALVAYGLPARRVARLDPARVFSEAHD